MSTHRPLAGGCRELRPARLRVSDLGALVCVGAGVQRVDHSQPRTEESPHGVLDGVDCVALGPVGVVRRGLGVSLVGSLVDLCNGCTPTPIRTCRWWTLAAATAARLGPFTQYAPRMLGLDRSAAAVDRARLEAAESPPLGPGSLQFRVADTTAPGIGEQLYAEIGEVNVHVRGVLHVVDPPDRPTVVASLQAMLGDRGTA
jgi:hypothetical protein